MEWRRIQSGVYLRSLVVCALALPAFGQFSGLAVTDDGGQVYFSSPLLLGSDPRSAAMPESRVYRWSSKGVELMGERGALAPGGSTVSSSSSDGASGAQVSGDGGLYGYTLYNACAQPGTSDGCAGIQSQAVLRGTINATAGQGVLQLSRNGRWALVVPQASPIRTSPPALWDIQNASVSYPPSAAALYGSVASDGSVVTDGGMWRAGTAENRLRAVTYLPENRLRAMSYLPAYHPMESRQLYPDLPQLLRGRTRWSGRTRPTRWTAGSS